MCFWRAICPQVSLKIRAVVRRVSEAELRWPHSCMLGDMDRIPSYFATICCVAGMTLACGGGEEASQATQAPPGGTSTGISQRYVGCIGPTANPNMYLLSVTEGRDFTTGEPPGTPIPRQSRLPEGAPPPIPPVTVTSGTPGGGPTPTTEVVTYRLRGEDLHQYVGHTVEILGRPERPSGERDERSSDTERSELLYIASIRDIANHCR